MDRSTPWWAQLQAAGEGWLPLAALAASAWLFASMAEAPRDTAPRAADLRCPPAGAAEAAPGCEPAPVSR